MILDDLSLKGKVALITGGGSGIGGGITRGLAEAGASIACVYGHHEPTEMRQYIESIGGEFLAIHADVSDMKALPVIMEKTLEHYGRLDILVNNAGIVRAVPRWNIRRRCGIRSSSSIRNQCFSFRSLRRGSL